tara:strand:+ start:408 stop:662 length:255 start_codon:yes stop_codon:yes gene_type:complete
VGKRIVIYYNNLKGEKMIDNDSNMYLTDQALGAVMMSLQKSLMEQTDIVPVLKEFKFRLSEQGLVVINPPLIKLQEDFEEIKED